MAIFLQIWLNVIKIGEKSAGRSTGCYGKATAFSAEFPVFRTDLRESKIMRKSLNKKEKRERNTYRDPGSFGIGACRRKCLNERCK